MAPTAKSNKGGDAKPTAAKTADKSKAAPAAAAKGKVEKPKAEAKPAAAAKNVKKAPEAAKEVKAAAKPAAAAAPKAAPAKDAKKAPAAAPKKDAKATTPAKDTKKAAAPAAAKPAAAPAAKKAEPAKPAAPAAEKKPHKAVAVKTTAPAKQEKKKSVVAAAAAATGKVGKKQVLRGKGLKKKKVQLRFSIDCNHIAEDNIMDVTDFEKYVKGRLKINGKVNNLGNSVTFECEKNVLVVNSDVHFSKAYLKYLTKKYLKKNSLRDWIRVVASAKEAYELRYFRISSNDDEDEDAE